MGLGIPRTSDIGPQGTPRPLPKGVRPGSRMEAKSLKWGRAMDARDDKQIHLDAITEGSGLYWMDDGTEDTNQYLNDEGNHETNREDNEQRIEHGNEHEVKEHFKPKPSSQTLTR
uniref:Uncharacterized protein n=1 Tax=Leersia perrieri TaxID=77586 RepID=A0A0D9XJ03_9ORYZ